MIGDYLSVNPELPVDPDVDAYYGSGEERSRLQTLSRLERERTRDIICRYLPPPPARVLDVGGGPGAYALWLAGRGYEVDLVDPIALHITQAREASDALRTGRLSSAELGDARSLAAADQSVDAVLMLGPLYHLPDPADRASAWMEAGRVLRVGGVLIAAAISRFASVLDGIGQGFLLDPEFREIAERGLVSGEHRNPERRPGWFTTAYFHTPEELRDEVVSAGLTVEALLAVEGVPGWLRGIDDWLDNEERRRILMDFLRELEREPSLLGASAHLIVVADRP